ncbi:MAG TPA: hypothetical protein DCG38_11450 [Eubacteriaceae bacterium]|nr:hypothetical protein [Eubacteriaceae bacterium]
MILLFRQPPLPPKREKRVGIYCRVSTNSTDQLKSLTAQIKKRTLLNFLPKLTLRVCKVA